MTHLQKKTARTLTALLVTAVLAGGWPTAGKAAAEASASAPVAGKVTEVRTSTEAIADWKNWTKDHAYRLETIQPAAAGQTANYDDLQMLKPLLQDKRIVFLGESSHGVGEFNSAKTRLIQFLHEEMGYNVLAFESGLPNTAFGYGRAGSAGAEETMKSSIFGVWWSKEILPLFDYIKSSTRTEKPLVLTGFDMQLQYPLIEGDWLQDAALAQKLKEAEEKLYDYSAGADIKAYQKDKSRLISVYKDVLKSLKSEKVQAKLKELYPTNPKLPVLLERSLNDRIRVAEEYVELSIKSNVDMAAGDYAAFLKTMEWRDQAMLNNLLWLANEVYPQEKFIVWGHNDHIRKAQSKVIGTPYPIKLMGEMLPDEFKKYSYVLGLYAASGKTADNTGAEHDVLPLEPGSVESILSAEGAPYTFIDLRYRQNERGNSWMFEPRLTYSWGMIPESLIARDQYDGLLLIDNVHPPQYLRNKK